RSRCLNPGERRSLFLPSPPSGDRSGERGSSLFLPSPRWGEGREILEALPRRAGSAEQLGPFLTRLVEQSNPHLLAQATQRFEEVVLNLREMDEVIDEDRPHRLERL